MTPPTAQASRRVFDGPVEASCYGGLEPVDVRLADTGTDEALPVADERIARLPLPYLVL